MLTNENACANIREVAERNKIKATGKNLKRGKPKAEYPEPKAKAKGKKPETERKKAEALR